MRLLRIQRHKLSAVTLALATVALCLAATTHAAQTQAVPPASAGHSAATTNATTPPEAPKSVFTNPATPQEGKDPFFPQSTRHRPPPTPAITKAPTSVPVELELKGISGTPDRRMAIINNRTFETGEEGEVVSNVGRIRITCKEIKADSVLVIVNGKERALTMRSRL